MILLAVQQEWPTGLVYRRNVGAMHDKDGNFIRFGLPGMADIGGIIEGRAIEIECKTEIGRQTKEQKNWQEAVERAGGLYVLARSREEAIEQLKRGLA